MFGSSAYDIAKSKQTGSRYHEGALTPLIKTEHHRFITLGEHRTQIDLMTGRHWLDSCTAEQWHDLGDDENTDREHREDDANAANLDKRGHKPVDQDRGAGRLETFRRFSDNSAQIALLAERGNDLNSHFTSQWVEAVLEHNRLAFL